MAVQRMSENGVWAYAITKDADGADLSWLTGVADGKVRTVASAGLSMLVSDVGLAEFGEAALRRNLEDLAWLEEVARAHHHVIDAAARLFPVLPTRLATVYGGDSSAAALLAGRGRELRAALRRVGGRVEWGVKAYATPEPDAGKRVPADTPEPGAARGDTRTTAGAASGAGAGLAYLRRRRDQLTAGRQARAAAVAGARALHAELAGQAAEARLHPPQSAALSGVRLPMLLNAAYLLNADDGNSFTTAVAAAATGHPELRIELTGPWPPYSFAGDGEQHAIGALAGGDG